MDKKKIQQLAVEVSLDTENKLKSKDGTHSTSMRTNDAVTGIEPIWVTMTNLPLGRLTLTLYATCIVVKNLVVVTIWSVAPVSITHSF